MQEFNYKKVSDIDDVLDSLASGNSRIIAGGTDLMLKIKHGTISPHALIDISEINGMRYIREINEQVHIGACTKLSDLSKNSLCKEKAPLLNAVINDIASTEIRNIGTVGGNLCCSRANCGICFLPGCKTMTSDRSIPACRNAAWSDLLLPFSAYNAQAVLKSRECERIVPVVDFLNEKGMLDLKPNEVMTEIYFTKPRIGGWGYAKLRTPTSMGFPFISVIANAENGKVSLTIGGSVGKVYQFKEIYETDITQKVLKELHFNNCMYFSIDYRRRVTPSVIHEAITQAIGGEADK